MHVRFIIFVLLTLLGGGLLSMAAQDIDGPASWRVPGLTPIGELPAQVFEPLDRDSLRRSGGCLRLPCPPGTTYTGYRVALGYASEVDVLQDGLLETLPSGDRVVRMRFEIPNATDLSFGFGRYRLPEGVTLYIFSPEYRTFGGRYSFGPWDASNNKPHGEFWTPMLPGEAAVVELLLTQNAQGETELQVGQVSGGYRDPFGLYD